MALSVAIYTRLSQDADGTQTATSRQQKACESFAQLRDWQVVRVYEDVDLSAYAPGVKRPAYDEMLEAVRAKRVDGIIAWKLDRFVRRSADFERLWEICEKSDAFIASAMEPIDTSTDLGLALVRVIVAFASLESATLGVRLRAKMRERAELGVPHSGAAAYGLRRGWQELEPTEVERIQEAIKRTLAGESLRSIILDWNRRGIPTHTKTSAGWSDASLRRILMSPRLAGLRQHQGVIIGPGNWPAIIDEATHERLKERLLPSAESAPRVKHQPTLLAGLLRCGVCGLSLSHVVEYRSGTDMFVCPPPPRGCSRISVRTRHITDAVVAALFDRLKDKGIGGRPSGNWDGLHDTAVSHALDTYNDALKELAKDYYVNKAIGRSQFLDARDGLYLEMEQSLDARMPRPRAFKGCRTWSNSVVAGKRSLWTSSGRSSGLRWPTPPCTEHHGGGTTTTRRDWQLRGMTTCSPASEQWSGSPQPRRCNAFGSAGRLCASASERGSSSQSRSGGRGCSVAARWSRFAPMLALPPVGRRHRLGRRSRPTPRSSVRVASNEHPDARG